MHNTSYKKAAFKCYFNQMLNIPITDEHEKNNIEMDITNRYET